jgi:cytochrome c oxidase subunit 4
MTQHKAHHVNYFLIFGFLCGLTLASVIADVFAPENKLVLIVIVLAVAVAKALFVMLFFMHLKFEGNWKYVLLAPTIILAFGLPMALMPDIGVHYYTVDVPQYDTALQAAEHDGSNGDHKSGAEVNEADPKGTSSKTKHD